MCGYISRGVFHFFDVEVAKQIFYITFFCGNGQKVIVVFKIYVVNNIESKKFLDFFEKLSKNDPTY